MPLILPVQERLDCSLCHREFSLRVAPDCADAMFDLALLLQQTNQYAEAAERWSRFAGQAGGLAKVDSGLDYAANFSSFACVA